MSRYLDKWGRTAATHPLRVLFVWLLVMASVVGLLVTQPKEIASGITLRDTPAQTVMDTIAKEIPEAAGTQGTFVFTADDGSRVDSPARAAAIADAMDAAAKPGYLVDREAKMAAQDVELRTQVTAKVEAKVAEELKPQLADMATKLSGAQAKLEAMGSPQGAAQAQKLGQFATTATDLAGKSPSEVISGATILFTDLNGAMTQLKTQGLNPSQLGLDIDVDKLATSPRAKADAGIEDALAEANGELSTLTQGTNPIGNPLVFDGKPVPGVVVSPDGTSAVATVQLKVNVSELPSGGLDSMLDPANAAAATEGMTMSASPSLLPTQPPIGGHEAIGVLIALVVLVLTLGSLIAAGLPIVQAVAGVFIGVGGAFALSSHFTMTTSTPALGLMIGLAVGIDYALFILHKYRGLVLHEGMDTVPAVGRALGTAGGAVLFAGMTVTVALLGLLTLGIDFVNTMALTAAVTVILAVLISLTALPAFLGLFGKRLFRKKSTTKRPVGASHPVAGRWISAVTKHPVMVSVGVIATLLAIAAPATGLRLGMPSGEVAAADSQQRANYDAITSGFGEGANAPLVVTMERTDNAAFDQTALLDLQNTLDAQKDVTSVSLMGSSPDRTMAIFKVTPTDGPTDPSTEALVHELRDLEISGYDSPGVTGLTAMNIDLSERLAAAVPVYLGLVLVISLLILVLVFRSILVPVVATLGFLLAILATFGLITLAFGTEGFTWMVGGDRAGPILSFLPIMATGILYGLAMDYQVFLGTSMREAYVGGLPARDAVKRGFTHASKVVAAAVIIMVSVFGAFVLADDTTIRQFGFALSAGILIDAVLIRMTLMPALLYLAGDNAWWIPRWLDRILPDLDIEGRKLGSIDHDSGRANAPEAGTDEMPEADATAPSSGIGVTTGTEDIARPVR